MSEPESRLWPSSAVPPGWIRQLVADGRLAEQDGVEIARVERYVEPAARKLVRERALKLWLHKRAELVVAYRASAKGWAYTPGCF